jgi:hypothetical protein
MFSAIADNDVRSAFLRLVFEKDAILLSTSHVEPFATGGVTAFDAYTALLHAVDASLVVPAGGGHEYVDGFATLRQTEEHFGNPLRTHQMSPLPVRRALHRAGTDGTQRATGFTRLPAATLADPTVVGNLVH